MKKFALTLTTVAALGLTLAACEIEDAEPRAATDSSTAKPWPPERDKAEAEAEAEAEPVEEAKPQLTKSQENALDMALSYLDFSPFSRAGLIDQLMFEGFDEADATWAVDNSGADWAEQAAQMAESYLDYSSFSRAGLLDQLIFEGFTPEQAEFGVASAGY